MTNSKTLVMTGSTGYIGKHFLVRMLRSGYRVIAIIRSSNGQLEQRLVDLLTPFGNDWRGQIEVIEGDMTKQGCGISTAGLEWMKQAGCFAMVHCAGLTSFDQHLAEDLRQHNLEGTKNALDLCRTLGIDELHHLSTAFVAGKHPDEWQETDLDLGQGFRNPYERSKFDTECYLHTLPTAGAPQIMIHRPSIVVGGQVIGEGNTASTIYTFLKTLNFVRECCQRDMDSGRNRFSVHGVSRRGEDIFIPIQVEADPDSTVNLVIMDQVIDALVDGLGKTNDEIKTRHIIGHDFRLDEIRNSFCSGMRVQGPKYVKAGTFERQKRNALEERFHRATSVYAPYMHCAPKFALGTSGLPQEHNSDYCVDLSKLVSDFKEQTGKRGAERNRDNLGSMALSCLGVDSAQRYFDRLISKDFGFDFLKRWRDIESSIHFVIKGSKEFDRTIQFGAGSACYVSAEEADCRYEMDESTFNQIIHNWLDPKQAFFKGLVKIDGDKEMGLKFAFLLSEYLQRVDDHVITELTG